jgi:DNA processing protein
MGIQKILPGSDLYPKSLKQLAVVPKQLYIKSENWSELLSRPTVAIVGTRRATSYGIAVTQKLTAELARRGIVIVSGLALGLDSVAHRAALESGGLTVAVLPSSLEKIYPATHYQLAQEIIKKGGALITEHAPGHEVNRGSFLERNRIVAGLSQAIVVPEAAERSGTSNTVSYALELGIPVLAVPGNITSPYSAGTNNLIKMGAAVVTSYKDVLESLNLTDQETTEIRGSTDTEIAILQLLRSGITDSNELMSKSALGTAEFQQTLTMLEIAGAIKPIGMGQWSLK